MARHHFYRVALERKKNKKKIPYNYSRRMFGILIYSSRINSTDYYQSIFDLFPMTHTYLYYNNIFYIITIITIVRRQWCVGKDTL